MDMNVVVTGATGFVGQWLVNELIVANNYVYILARDKNKVPSNWKNNVKIIECGLEKLKLLDDSWCMEHKPEVFYHLAWAGTAGEQRADVDLQLRNVKFTVDAVNLAKRIGCKKFINAGSIMEYEAVKYMMQDSAKPGMGYVYSSAKLTADFMAKAVANNIGISYINIIISNIYGKGEYSVRFLNSTLRKMLNNEKISMTSGLQLYDFIYVQDAARAIRIVGEKGEKSKNYYIGNKEQKTLKDFVVEMKKILQSDSEIGFGDIEFEGPMLNYKEFDTYAVYELGFDIEVSFEDGIKKTKEWLLECDYEKRI